MSISFPYTVILFLLACFTYLVIRKRDFFLYMSIICCSWTSVEVFNINEKSITMDLVFIVIFIATVSFSLFFRERNLKENFIFDFILFAYIIISYIISNNSLVSYAHYSIFLIYGVFFINAINSSEKFNDIVTVLIYSSLIPFIYSYFSVFSAMMGFGKEIAYFLNTSTNTGGTGAVVGSYYRASGLMIEAGHHALYSGFIFLLLIARKKYLQRKIFYLFLFLAFSNLLMTVSSSIPLYLIAGIFLFYYNNEFILIFISLFSSFLFFSLYSLIGYLPIDYSIIRYMFYVKMENYLSMEQTARSSALIDYLQQPLLIFGQGFDEVFNLPILNIYLGFGVIGVILFLYYFIRPIKRLSINNYSIIYLCLLLHVLISSGGGLFNKTLWVSLCLASSYSCLRFSSIDYVQQNEYSNS